MRTSSGLVVLVALALPVQALAQMGTSKSGMAALATFKSFDRDGDGGLSTREMLSRGREKSSAALFSLLDGDEDGRLALKEFTGAASGAMIGRFDAYDANKDGFVAKREFPAKLDPLLVAALDRDRDGKVALAEIRPAFTGTRMVQAADAPARKAASAREGRRPYCWITGFGDNQWTLEMPVTGQSCRTR